MNKITEILLTVSSKIKELIKVRNVQIALVVLLIISIPLGVYLVRQQQQLRSKAFVAAGSLNLSPATLNNTRVGGTFSVDLMLNIPLDPRPYSISAVDATIEFDDKLEMTGFISSGALNTVLIPSSTINSIDNTSSPRHFRLVAADTTKTPISGTINLGTMTFRVMNEGVSTIRFNNNSRLTAYGVKDLLIPNTQFVGTYSTESVASLTPSLSPQAPPVCNNVTISGLNQTDVTLDGGPVYTVDNHWTQDTFLNRSILVSKSPDGATVAMPASINVDSGSASNAQPLNITTVDTGTGPSWIANIPSNTSASTDNSYTLRVQVISGSSTANCRTVRVVVRHAPSAPTPTPSLTCPTSITSTEARFKVGTLWRTAATVSVGDSIQVAGFHNNQTSTFASDVRLIMEGPQNDPANQTVILSNNELFTPPTDGIYILTAESVGTTGSACTGTGTLTVNPPPLPTPTPTSLLSPTPTLTEPPVCNNVTISGLNQTDVTFDGGPVYTADNHWTPDTLLNRSILVSKSPFEATIDMPSSINPDSGSASNAQPLNITTVDTGTGPSWIANIPSNVSNVADNSYTFKPSVSSGGRTTQCRSVKVMVTRSPSTPTPTPSLTCPTSITSTEARFKVGTLWRTAVTVSVGDSIQVAGFHNNQTSTFASDVRLIMEGPQNDPANQTVILSNNELFTPPTDGIYILTAESVGTTGSACTGTGTLTVNPPPVVTPTPSPAPLTPTPSGIFACDFNGNNRYDDDNFINIWVSEIQRSSNTMQADCDKDGDVDIVDYNKWRNRRYNLISQ